MERLPILCVRDTRDTCAHARYAARARLLITTLSDWPLHAPKFNCTTDCTVYSVYCLPAHLAERVCDQTCYPPICEMRYEPDIYHAFLLNVSKSSRAIIVL